MSDVTPSYSPTSSPGRKVDRPASLEVLSLGEQFKEFVERIEREGLALDHLHVSEIEK